MRSLPKKITPPPIRGLEDIARLGSNVATAFQDVSRMALTAVVRVTTTGAAQSVDVGVPAGTWFAGRASDYVRLREVSTIGSVITFQADIPNVDLDLIVLF